MVTKYICAQCGVVFESWAELVFHHRTVGHMGYTTVEVGEKTPSEPQLTYVCSTCGAAFATLFELQKHGYAAKHDVTPRPPPIIPRVKSGSIAGVGGYENIYPKPIVDLLLELRNRFIRPEVHRRLHPLI